MARVRGSLLSTLGGPEWVPARLQSGPAPAVVGIWAVNQQMGAFCLLSFPLKEILQIQQNTSGAFSRPQEDSGVRTRHLLSTA